MCNKRYQLYENIIFCSINFIISYGISYKIMLKHIVHEYPQLFFILFYLINLVIINVIFKNYRIFFKLILSSFFAGGLALIISATYTNSLCSGVICQPAHITKTIIMSFIGVFYFSKQYISITVTLIIYLAIKNLYKQR